MNTYTSYHVDRFGTGRMDGREAGWMNKYTSYHVDRFGTGRMDGREAG